MTESDLTMTCDACVGLGDHYSEVTGRYQECSICRGKGELIICASFITPPGVVFRNCRCANCGVRSEIHLKVNAKEKELSWQR